MWVRVWFDIFRVINEPVLRCVVILMLLWFSWALRIKWGVIFEGKEKLLITFSTCNIVTSCTNLSPQPVSEINKLNKCYFLSPRHLHTKIYFSSSRFKVCDSPQAQRWENHENFVGSTLTVEESRVFCFSSRRWSISRLNVQSVSSAAVDESNFSLNH